MLYSFLILGLLVVSVRHWRSGRPSRPVALALTALALFLLSWPPVAHLAIRTLEWPYTPTDYMEDRDAQVIVVLSGRVTGTGPGAMQPAAGENTYQRSKHAAWLHKNWRALPILACGGRLLRPETVSAASIMREVLIAEGVPASSIWTEQRSESTYESSVFAAEILRSKGIRKLVLVTEAYHMARAKACFQKQGLAVVPAACEFRILRPAVGTLLPKIASVRDIELAVHEWAGLAWYRAQGRI